MASSRFPFTGARRFHRLVLALLAATAMGAPASATTVRFRLLDAATGRTTPAMVCITGTTDGQVRLPPDGRVCAEPSHTDTFYKGIRFEPDRNWIGPVRKTMGRGDNDDRSYVYELRPSLPYWHEPVMYQTSGDFEIELPAGRWQLAVEHGMEFVPVFETIELDGQQASLDKTVELERWVDLAKLGWWSGDVHVHHPMLRPEHREYLLQYAIAEDLHVVNILEMGHHKGTEFKQEGFGAKFRAHRGNYWLVPGQEEPRSTFGHIIGLNGQRLSRVDDLSQYDFYDLVFRDLHDQPGALVGFAHLSWNGCNLPRGFPWYVTTGEIDFVELLQLSAINTMDYYDYLNLGFRLTAAAGSDVPWGSTIGEVRTYVHTGPRLDIDTWFASLKKGRTFVSNGPALDFTVDGEPPGTELARAAGDTVTITARAWGHPAVGRPRVLTIASNDGVVREVINESKRDELTVSVDLPLDRSRWLVASTACDNNAVAHTTPVYVIVDGQPTWCPQRGPLVIARQLQAISNIAAEFDHDTSPRGRGIRERLARARAFYADLRKKMLER